MEKKDINLTHLRNLNNKHTVLTSIIIAVITLFIGSLFQWDSNAITGFDKLTGDILISVVCVMIIMILGIYKTAGFQRKGFCKGLLYGIPFLLIGIGAAVLGNIGVDLSELRPISIGGMILFTVNMLFVGINEEFSMRSLILNNLMVKYENDGRGEYKALLVASLIFGAIHLVNVFFMPPINVIVQAINAASAGVLFGVIFLRSRNIWACILIHATVDWLSLFVGQCFIGGASVLSIQMTLSQGVRMVLLGSIPPLVISLFLLRRNTKVDK